MIDNDLQNAITFVSGEKPNQIYMATDLHFYKNECRNKKPFNTKVKMDKFFNECKKLGNDDILIVLGDIDHVDCTLEQNEKIKIFFKSLPIKKILVRGNHDILSDNYYKECGFIYIVDHLTYKNIVFTHLPAIWDKNLTSKRPIVDSNYFWNYRRFTKTYVCQSIYNINIHGHIHGSGEYWDTEAKGHYDMWRDTNLYSTVNKS